MVPKFQRVRLFLTGVTGVILLSVGMEVLGAEISTSILSQNSNRVVSSVAAEAVPSGKTNQGQTSFAYRQTVGKLMATECLFYIEKLGLSEGPWLFDRHHTRTNVNPPELGSLGSIETYQFLYSFLGSDTKPLTNGNTVEMFLEPGKLAYLIQKKPFDLVESAVGNDPRAINKWLAHLKNRLTTNSAYQLATQWLRSVDVDVDALEKKYPPQVSQHYFYDGPVMGKPDETPSPDTPKTLLPIFDVCWGGDPDSSPPVWIAIDGTSKSLIHLRMEDTRFSRRPPIVVTNREELLKLPDPPTKQLSLMKGGIFIHSNAVPQIVRGAAREMTATLAMLREANALVAQLGLPESKPLLARHVEAHVFPPGHNTLGYLISENYEYHFEGSDPGPHKTKAGYKLYQEPGKLIGLIKHRLGKYQDEKGKLTEAFFNSSALVGTNGAYQLATQWLASIQLDVPALEKKYKPIIVQADFEVGKGARRKGPMYYVSWGTTYDQDPPVFMTVFGLTRELTYLVIRDTRLLKREAIPIP